MNTPGPETSVFTSVCAFPQKEQRYNRLRVWVASADGMSSSNVNVRMTVNHTLTRRVNPLLTRSVSHANPPVRRNHLRPTGRSDRDPTRRLLQMRARRAIQRGAPNLSATVPTWRYPIGRTPSLPTARGAPSRVESGTSAAPTFRTCTRQCASQRRPGARRPGRKQASRQLPSGVKAQRAYGIDRSDGRRCRDLERCCAPSPSSPSPR
jgi:hypothetical protein